MRRFQQVGVLRVAEGDAGTAAVHFMHFADEAELLQQRQQWERLHRRQCHPPLARWQRVQVVQDLLHRFRRRQPAQVQRCTGEGQPTSHSSQPSGWWVRAMP